MWSLAVSCSLVLPFMTTPYALGSAFMVTLVVCVIYFMGVGPLWYPAVLFLVYAGGMMVLFMYMACLSPNMRIKGVGRKLFCVVGLVCFALCFMAKEKHSVVQTSSDVGELSKWLSQVQSPLEVSSSEGGSLMVFCGLLLFVALLAVVKLCKSQSGPLRPFKRSKKKGVLSSSGDSF
uniref:NADH-ubiquinone oxidoreductase chain 6 n=1 Tax=Nipponacmea fuscoviridis TaxID=225302 RepID=A0A6B9Q881_9GAST|nr:NADH dehydrogenase subunit 6 [Nipponacmea fuscoviridis]QHE50289.1 NADH dehydrogenase subunit 6 [Nipponacmea fuscoviridis]QVH34242.1 NADH dehydrogenase subunit 6 [Nipponacmea fuscoviridis]